MNDAADTGIIAPANAASVHTGFEISFKLSDLGYTSTDYSNGKPINVAAMISYGSHTVGTNQILGPYSPSAAELQHDGGIYTYYGSGNFDFSNETRFQGNQYFSVLPAVVQTSNQYPGTSGNDTWTLAVDANDNTKDDVWVGPATGNPTATFAISSVSSLMFGTAATGGVGGAPTV